MDDVADHIVKPSGRRQYTPLPRQLAQAWNLPVERGKGTQHRENTEKAKTLFEEAGVSSWTPKIAVPKNDRMREKLAHTIVHGLRGIGFSKARVRTYSWSSFREHVMSGNASDYAMYIGSWPGFPDPDTFMYPLFHQRMEGLTNGTYYRNPELMAKIERAREITNRAERRRLYTEAITTLLEDRVHLPVYTLHNSFGVKDRVQGFNPHPLSQFNPQFVSPDGALSLRA